MGAGGVHHPIGMMTSRSCSSTLATDAGAVAYRTHLAGAGHLGISAAKVLATFAAIAPVVGSARVLSAASELATAGFLRTDR